MPQFPASVDLSSLNGTNGFKLSGVSADDWSGYSVASAGDINGDGFADLIVGAPYADPGFISASYVVYGKASGFASNLNLSSLNGTNGFKIGGVAARDRSGNSVASAGDVNGDGFADLIIGAPQADPNGANSGASYVVFGKASSFGSILNLASLDGTNGFAISGAAAGDYSGWSVASAGDVNGDGFADLIIGALRAAPHGDESGASYVVFGKASGFASNIQLSSLNGDNGFKISGSALVDLSGGSVASAGDINGDGFADLLVGASRADSPAYDSGASYAIFGKATGFDANIDLADLDGVNGFKLSGVAVRDWSGSSVASAGDVNGDGFADLIIGAGEADTHGIDSGASYVVFGKADGFAADLDLAGLNGIDGFRVSGVAADDKSGWSVASAGDVNGDGFDDLIVGAPYATAHAGASYIVFGKASGFAANFDLSTLNGTNGFKLKGVGGDYSGMSVASAGDANADGFADLIVGAWRAQPHGEYSGASYVVFGVAPDTAVDRVGTNASQTLAGGNFNDTLSGLGGKDKLYGHGGNDLLDGGVGADVMIGGPGNDMYAADNVGDIVVEASGEGTDTIQTTLSSYTLAPHIENLIFTGVGNFVGTGNGLNNSLAGGAGDDTLRGGGGDDTLIGGAGLDKIFGDGGNDTLVIAAADLLAGEIYEGGAGTDTLQFLNAVVSVDLSGVAIKTIENLSGFAAGVSMTRSELAGFAGVVDTGAITLTTAGSIDVTAADIRTRTINLASTGSTILTFADSALVSHIINGGAGGDTVTATGGGLGVSLSGNGGNDKLTGGSADDTLSGGNDKDWLDGGMGADDMFGGAGDDTYVVDNAGDLASENPDEGIDTVETTLSSCTLSTDIERLVFTGAGSFAGTGNGLDNRLTGGTGSDTLAGGAGNDLLDGGGDADTLVGGIGNDTYFVDDIGDVITENAGEGVDMVQTTLSSLTPDANVEILVYIGTGDFSGNGTALNDRLKGGVGNDTLAGEAGSDILYGGFGNDILIGGTGRDLFVFDAPLDAATNVDAIADFSAVDDSIRLSQAIFTQIAAGILSAGAFFVGAAAQDGSDRILYNSATGGLSYDPDGTGAAAATQFATLASGLLLTNRQFSIA